MFLGTYEHTIDDKGRLFLPAKFRDAAKAGAGTFVITRGMEQCLFLYAKETFDSLIVSRLSDLPVKDQQQARAFKRLLLAGAQEVSLDEMGRILVPKNLADSAAFKKNISVLGVGQRVELWATEKWTAYSRKAAQAFQQVGKQLDL